MPQRTCKRCGKPAARQGMSPRLQHNRNVGELHWESVARDLGYCSEQCMVADGAIEAAHAFPPTEWECKHKEGFTRFGPEYIGLERCPICGTTREVSR